MTNIFVQVLVLGADPDPPWPGDPDAGVSDVWIGWGDLELYE